MIKPVRHPLSIHFWNMQNSAVFENIWNRKYYIITINIFAIFMFLTILFKYVHFTTSDAHFSFFDLFYGFNVSQYIFLTDLIHLDVVRCVSVFFCISKFLYQTIRFLYFHVRLRLLIIFANCSMFAFLFFFWSPKKHYNFCIFRFLTFY